MKPVKNKVKHSSIQIFRLDYKNPSEHGGLPVLPNLTSIEDLTDENEVHYIDIYFDTFEDATAFASQYPKWLKMKPRTCSYYFLSGDEPKTVYSVGATFRTFWMNNATGEKNESALRLRNAWIKILREL